MPGLPIHHAAREFIVVDGLRTSYLVLGQGPTMLLLHSGEYGAGAELSWEYNLDALSEDHTVIAPDWLGFGESAKVFDFEAGTSRLLTHLRAFCETLGLTDLPVVATSMGASMALADASADEPQLAAAALVAICGGGEVAANPDVDALFAYDGSLEAMFRIVSALFADPEWAADEDYVKRRHRESIRPGAWECVSAPRFRSPDAELHRSRTKKDPTYERIRIPTLLIEGASDKLKPAGWSQRLAHRIPGAESLLVPGAGHFPHIERPDVVHEAVRDFLAQLGTRAPQR